ncbi:MAG: ribosome maturation factor RimM [Eubacteriales bacterium]|nr:ribosome maturation factor RimM [Eubacteriales bacterium]
MRISNDTVVVGKITTTHGLKGTVKVLPMTEKKERFYDLTQIMAELADGKQKVLTIEGISSFKEGFLMDFKEIKDVNAAQKLRGAYLQIPRSQAMELEEGEYYIFEIIGAEVFTDEGERLGILENVIETGANDVYEVKTEDGKEILIPVIPDCVLEVNTEEKKVVVHLLEGMRE